MIKNYFKTAVRNLLKNRLFTAINILGLVLGMTACLLLLNYATFQLSFDRFFDQSEHIYRITHEFYQQGELQSQSAAVYSPLARSIQEEIPEVSVVTKIHPISGTISFKQDEIMQSLKEDKIYFVDSSFLGVFPFKIISGNTSTLHSPDAAVITRSTAKRYFGNDDPIGQQLYWYNSSYQATFTVGAIVEDMPKNSHLAFDFLFSFSTLERLESGSMQPLEENWGWPGFYTYVKIAPSSDVITLQAKIDGVVDRQIGEALKNWNNGSLKFYLQPLTDIHLYSTFPDELSASGDASAVQFIGIIAAIVLFIAYINYTNLSTVRSLERAREVGIRKVMGSRRRQLISQFVSESFLLNAAALLLSFLLYYTILPFTQYFTTTSLTDMLWDSPYIILLLTLLLLVGPLLASLYPAIVLSNYQPVSVLKGNFKSSAKGSILRKGLVTLQYVASVAMITGTLVVLKQIQYMQNKDLGVNLDQLLILHGPSKTNSEENSQGYLQAFKESLVQQTSITQVSLSSAVPGTKVGNVMMHKSKIQEWENAHTIASLKIDHDFIDTYKAEMIAGRNFSVDITRDMQGETLLINEAAVRLLGFQNPDTALQQFIESAMGEEKEVIGVVKNHHQHSVAQNYEPLLFVVEPAQSQYVSVKIDLASFNGYTDLQRQLETIEAIYKEHFPNDAFDYFFLDQFFNQQYQAEIKFSRLFTFFSILSIVVACLGLFGLSSYTTLQRIKEIGIRKVLGASEKNIISLLSKDYIKLVLIASLIAIPIANYFTSEWLRSFAHQTELSWWLFTVPAIVLLLVTLLSVGGQTLRAARQNPVDSLRDE